MGKEGKDGNSAFRKERGSVSDIVLRDGRKGGGGEGGGPFQLTKSFCVIKTFVVLLENFPFSMDRLRKHLTSSLCHHEVSSISA